MFITHSLLCSLLFRTKKNHKSITTVGVFKFRRYEKGIAFKRKFSFNKNCKKEWLQKNKFKTKFLFISKKIISEKKREMCANLLPAEFLDPFYLHCNLRKYLI